MNLIETGWKDLEKKVLPECIGQIQRKETRRAFYAGAAFVVSLLKQIGKDLTEGDTGIHALNLLHYELESFKKDLKEGRA